MGLSARMWVCVLLSWTCFHSLSPVSGDPENTPPSPENWGEGLPWVKGGGYGAGGGGGVGGYEGDPQPSWIWSQLCPLCGR